MAGTPDQAAPVSLDFIEPLLKKHGVPVGESKSYRALIRSLEDDELALLRQAYAQLSDEDRLKLFSAWLADRQDEFWKQWRQWCKTQEGLAVRKEPRLSDAHAPRRPAEGEIFPILDALREARIKPFADRRIVYSPPPPRLDWSKLPSELTYLREPAMKYGHLEFDDDREEFLKRIRSDQRRELAALRQRVMTMEDDSLWQWQRAHPMGEHPEATLIGNLCAVLNELPTMWLGHEE